MVIILYFIKSLKWTRHYKKDTWWKSNSNGYTDFICNAGIYTEEDRLRYRRQIEERQVAFVPIKDRVIDKGIKELETERRNNKKLILQKRKYNTRELYSD